MKGPTLKASAAMGIMRAEYGERAMPAELLQLLADSDAVSFEHAISLLDSCRAASRLQRPMICHPLDRVRDAWKALVSA